MTTDLDLTDATETDDDDATTCDVCGDPAQAGSLDDEGQCPLCHQIAQDEAEGEARDEAISDAQGELDEAESELDGQLEELQELQERIASTRRTIKAARARLARLETE